jgi:hypothetical protein
VADALPGLVPNSDGRLIRLIRHAHLAEAIAIANGLQTSFRIRDQIRSVKLPGVRSLNPDKCLDYLGERLPPNGDRLVCVSTRPFSDDAFSVEDRRVFAATICDWEEEFAPPSLQTYLLYQMAGAFLSFSADLTWEQNAELMHDDETRGCLMDYCEEKEDIKFGMLAGYLCGACSGELLRLGATAKQLDAVGRILRYVQLSSTGRQKRMHWDNALWSCASQKMMRITWHSRRA